MPFPWFKNGRLLFCNGSLAATCCGSQILTISLELVDNVGVYNAVAFQFSGETWGNACGQTNNGWVGGINRGSWISSFDMSILATEAAPTVEVFIRADCNMFHAGDTVGFVQISATYRGVTAVGSLVPFPVNEVVPDFQPGCPASNAAALVVLATLNEGVEIL